MSKTNTKEKTSYWLRISGLQWQEVTREKFIEIERLSGFYPMKGQDIATAGFSGGAVEGRVTYGEITEKLYGWDSEFIKVTKQK